MQTHHADDLSDRTDWIAASIELQTDQAETEARATFERLAILHRRITEREHDAEVPFRTLAMRLALSETEQQIVMLLVAMRIRPDLRSRIQQQVSAAELSLDSIRTLIYGTQSSLRALEELASTGTLRRLLVIERNDDGGPAHETKQTWSVASRVLALLHGQSAIDPALARLCRTRPPVASDALGAGADANPLARTAMEGTAVVVASGLEGLGRRTLLSATAKAAGRLIVEIDARRLSKDPAALVVQLRAIARECRLLARAPLLTNLDALADEKEHRIDLVGTELVALVDGPILVTTGVQRPKLDWDRPVVVIEMAQPSSAQRASLWAAALGGASAQDAQHLATHYPLAPALIARAAEAARARAGARKLEPDDIYAGIRAVLDDRVGHFAKRVSVTQTWQDLVLPPDQVDAIVELMARIRERRRVYEDWGFAAKVGKGLGTSALFSGPPGTGKTMVAALIANDLGLELYQVDLGKVVSKYIGETEKNLAALFDAAEAGHAVLLFDEADALFGKRTEVKSSNDRYANLETNYLLQRLESFTGTCLLTSNHETNIDPAFLRRLSLHLRFDLPDAAERVHLWRAMLPGSAPVAADVDVESLGRRFAMSGGYIRNAAVRAAFLAADQETEITPEHLERAARLEYEGMGKLAVEAR
ncbi:MAG: AAA family ATPase [Myxococcota bacterium]|nr:AAA family ATPase [Myxococcota bacterium]